jgi:hypothetical protein
MGVTIDPASGTLYVAESSANKIRAISSAGVTTTLAGSGAADGTLGHFKLSGNLSLLGTSTSTVVTAR